MSKGRSRRSSSSMRSLESPSSSSSIDRRWILARRSRPAHGRVEARVIRQGGDPARHQRLRRLLDALAREAVDDPRLALVLGGDQLQQLLARGGLWLDAVLDVRAVSKLETKCSARCICRRSVSSRCVASVAVAVRAIRGTCGNASASTDSPR